MGYVVYIWHPRGPLYPICSEKFDKVFCPNIDLPTSSWMKAEWNSGVLISYRSMLAEGSCVIDSDYTTNLKILKFRTMQYDDFLETLTTLRCWRCVISLKVFIRVHLCFWSCRRLLVETLGTRFVSSDRPGLFLLCSWLQLFTFTAHYIHPRP